jgi:hypothetical protein
VNWEKKAGLDSNKASSNSSMNFASIASLSSWNKAETFFVLPQPIIVNYMKEANKIINMNLTRIHQIIRPNFMTFID